MSHPITPVRFNCVAGALSRAKLNSKEITENNKNIPPIFCSFVVN